MKSLRFYGAWWPVDPPIGGVERTQDRRMANGAATFRASGGPPADQWRTVRSAITDPSGTLAP